MHIMRSLLTATLLLLTLSACAQDSVKLAGTIRNKTTDQVTVTYNTNRIAYYPQEYSATVDDRGWFALTFAVPKNAHTEVTLRYGAQAAELVVRAGDSLVMTADAGRFDSSLRYAGRGAAVQNMLAKHALQFGKTQVYVVRVKEAINKHPKDFIAEINQLLKEELAFTEKNKAGLPAGFIKYWNAWHQYFNYFIMQQYPRAHELVALRRQTDTIPETNNLPVKQMPMAFDDELLEVPSYLMYLTGAVESKLRAEEFGYLQNDAAKMQRLQDSVYARVFRLMPPRSTEYFIAQDLYGRIRYQDAAASRRLLTSYSKHWPGSEYEPMLENEVATMERLAPGQPAPDFDIVTEDGMHKKLSDLKGKVVYLTFWAAWDKRSVSEMVNFQPRKELMKKQAVEFVYISIDKYPEDAKKWVSKYKISGTFVYAPGEWHAKEIQQYGVQGLPAYFLIDKEGKFAPQPAIPPTQATELILQIGRLNP